MIKLNTSNWKKLLEADTPPCLSMMIPMEGQDQTARNAALENALRRAEKLLKANYSSHSASQLLRDAPECLGEVDPQTKGVIFFLSPELRCRAELDTPLVPNVVVANSFHITPLLEGCWHLRGLGLFVGKEHLEIYCSTDAFSEAIFRAPHDEMDSLLHLCRGAAQVWVSGEEEAAHLLGSVKEKIPGLKCLGLQKRELFKKRIKSEDRERVIGELRELESAFNQKAPRELSEKALRAPHKLNAEEGKILFAPLRKQQWGRMPSERYDVVLHSERSKFGGSDDCVVDDALEAGLRAKLKVHLVDSSKWIFRSPFIVL